MEEVKGHLDTAKEFHGLTEEVHKYDFMHPTHTHIPPTHTVTVKLHGVETPTLPAPQDTLTDSRQTQRYDPRPHTLTTAPSLRTT